MAHVSKRLARAATLARSKLSQCRIGFIARQREVTAGLAALDVEQHAIACLGFGVVATHVHHGAAKVVYLDPDIAVFQPLHEIEELLEESDILLTPHQLKPNATTFAIIDNEICSLKHGTFNLGFLAIRNGADGRACAEWWRDLLPHFPAWDRCFY